MNGRDNGSELTRRTARERVPWWLFGILVLGMAARGAGGVSAAPSPLPDVEMSCDDPVECLRILRVETGETDKRMAAIVALGRMKEKRAVPDLIAIVRSHVYGDRVYNYNDTPHSLLVVTAMRALGTIGDRRAVPALVEFVQKEAYIQYRVLAAETIKMIGIAREDIPMMLDLLNDSHTSVRYIIFEAIRFADDPISRGYTRRFINFIPRADMIEDSVTPLPESGTIGVPIYNGARYVFSASASEAWIMRDRPESLDKVTWVHTFLTHDSLDAVVGYYERVLKRKAMTRSQVEKKYNYTGTNMPDASFIGRSFGFVVKRGEWPGLSVPVAVVSLFEDGILDGTVISINAPK